MKLSEWSKQQGISYRTAWQWFKDGKLPVPSVQTSSGTILVQEELDKPTEQVTIYVRVSSSDQKGDLDRQISRLVQYAGSKGLPVNRVVSEIGSGMNGHRAKLLKMLRDPTHRIVLIEHKDRLMRFGYEYIESALAAQGRRLIVLDSGELKDDLAQDMIEILTSFCARLYGRRSAKNRAKRALQIIQKKDIAR